MSKYNLRSSRKNDKNILKPKFNKSKIENIKSKKSNISSNPPNLSQYEYFIPDIGNMITEYLGGKCYEKTQDGNKCWSYGQNNNEQNNNKQNNDKQNNKIKVDNCNEFCSINSENWIIPILTSFPTYCVIDGQKLNFQHGKYVLQFNNIQHHFIKEIQLVYYYGDQYTHNNVELTIGAYNDTEEKRNLFLKAQDEWIGMVEIPRLRDVEIKHKGYYKYVSHVETDLTNDNVFINIVEEDVEEILLYLYTNIIKPIFDECDGLQAKYSIDLTNCYGYKDVKNNVCKTFLDIKEPHWSNNFQLSNKYWKHLDITIPEFPDQDAIWKVQYSGGKNYIFSIVTTTNLSNIEYQEELENVQEPEENPRYRFIHNLGDVDGEF